MIIKMKERMKRKEYGEIFGDYINWHWDNFENV